MNIIFIFNKPVKSNKHFFQELAKNQEILQKVYISSNSICSDLVTCQFILRFFLLRCVAMHICTMYIYILLWYIPTHLIYFFITLFARFKALAVFGRNSNRFRFFLHLIRDDLIKLRINKSNQFQISCNMTEILVCCAFVTGSYTCVFVWHSIGIFTHSNTQ